MKPLLTALMLGNAALFVFGALQHAGIAVGSLHEPVIVPASVVEVLCALALSWGAAAVLKQSRKAWRAAFIGNLVAIMARWAAVGGYAPDSPLPEHLGRCSAADAPLGSMGTLRRNLHGGQLQVRDRNGQHRLPLGRCPVRTQGSKVRIADQPPGIPQNFEFPSRAMDLSTHRNGVKIDFFLPARLPTMPSQNPAMGTFFWAKSALPLVRETWA
jgi:hypothetical protein